MNRGALIEWAEQHATGPVESSPDSKWSITSKLIRFEWDREFTVAVGADSDGKTRINAVLDAVALAMSGSKGAIGSLNLLLGTHDNDKSLKEHLGAISTLLASMRSGPTVNVWTITDSSGPGPVALQPTTFTTDTPQRWATLLTSAADAPVAGVAAAVVARLADRPAFALYPKLTSLKSARPWQMRLDGLEIGRVGATSATLELASTNVMRPGNPRDTWRDVVGAKPLSFDLSQVDSLVSYIDTLISAWSKGQTEGAVLQHGQAEHALEAHLLSGRLALTAPQGPLRLAVPFRSGTLGAAQFPTLWGDVTAPARYLDALLADDEGRPWAVELKDQDAGGGQGAYLRHGVGQAVLYRHYIRSASALEPWFDRHGLHPEDCQAALAFPTASAGAAATIERLRQLAEVFDVNVIEFARPG